MAKDQQLLLAFFDNEAAADAAAKQLKEWDEAVDGIKFDNIGVLVKDSKGKIKTQKLGSRHTGAGIALGALAGVLTGGISIIAGAAVGGALGHFAQKGLGLTKEDLARIDGELDGGKAAVGILLEPSQVKAVSQWIDGVGGKLETYAVTDEAINQAAEAVQAQPEAAATTEAPAAETQAAPTAEAPAAAPSEPPPAPAAAS